MISITLSIDKTYNIANQHTSVPIYFYWPFLNLKSYRTKIKRKMGDNK
jgi:hypothetical protein